MFDSSLKQLTSLINQQIDCLEDLEEHLAKAQALSQVMLGENFLDHSKIVIHNYFGTVNEILEQSRGLCAQIVKDLLHGRISELETFNTTLAKEEEA
jgi:hypothetical protein